MIFYTTTMSIGHGNPAPTLEMGGSHTDHDAELLNLVSIRNFALRNVAMADTEPKFLLNRDQESFLLISDFHI